MAVAIRDAGQRLGTPNGCSKRLVQRWEAGQVTLPRAVYVRALERVFPSFSYRIESSFEVIAHSDLLPILSRGSLVPVAPPADERRTPIPCTTAALVNGAESAVTLTWAEAGPGPAQVWQWSRRKMGLPL
jgi:hypothetical protein